MTLKIPVIASPVALPNWIRQTADAVNGIGGKVTGIIARIAALEAFTAAPFTVTSITLTPATLPASPVKGMTVYDIADDKVKTWTGAAWVAHY